MQEWEYEIWYLDPSRGTASIRDELEPRGREGWELVATPVAWDFDPAGGERQLVGILKRAVRAELPVAVAREFAPGDVIYDPGPVAASSTEVAVLPDDPSAVEVVDAMIRRVKADLVANRRERIVSDDRNKKLRTTHLRVELHLLKQSRAWVRTPKRTSRGCGPGSRPGEARTASGSQGGPSGSRGLGTRWRPEQRAPPTMRVSSSRTSCASCSPRRGATRSAPSSRRSAPSRSSSATRRATDREVESALRRVAGRKVIGQHKNRRPARADESERAHPCSRALDGR